MKDKKKLVHWYIILYSDLS